MSEFTKGNIKLSEGLSWVFDGNARITRRAWNNPAVYVGLEQGQLCIKGHPNDGLWHPWTITESDWFSEDWEVVE